MVGLTHAYVSLGTHTHTHNSHAHYADGTVPSAFGRTPAIRKEREEQQNGK